MLNPDQARDKVEQLVERARRAGADGVDALCIGDSMDNVSVRMGSLEDVSRSEGERFGLRVFLGQRSASVASSDLSSEAMDALVARAMAMAAEAPEDEYAGLASAELLDHGPFADLDSWDEAEPDPAALKERALIPYLRRDDVARDREAEISIGGPGKLIAAQEDVLEPHSRR